MVIAGGRASSPLLRQQYHIEMQIPICTMNRKYGCCTICENSNLTSICAGCVNYRLREYYTLLKSLKSQRNYLYSRLNEELLAKGKADDQVNWKVLQNEKLARLREKLRISREKLSQGKAKKVKMSNELKEKYALIDSAKIMLEKNRTEQLEKSYPNYICAQSLGHMAITSERLHRQTVVVKQICRLFPQRRVKIDSEKKDGFNDQYDVICNARLPRGLDPHSVPSEELAASLGYMVQFLNLFVRSLALPSLHFSGFAGSSSRIWQRDSYWDARPSSRSDEYPLFVPRQNCCTTGGENSWSDRSSSNFVIASIESERKPHLDSSGSSSFNYSSTSSHSVETHSDLQNGIAVIKNSVACITAYCYNSLCLDFPSDASTFEAFAKVLTILSSSKEVHSVVSLKMACSRSYKQVEQFNKSISNVNSRNICDSNLPSSAASFLYATEIPDVRKKESLIDGWDLVEHLTLPPPPSEAEDIDSSHVHGC